MLAHRVTESADEPMFSYKLGTVGLIGTKVTDKRNNQLAGSVAA